MRVILLTVYEVGTSSISTSLPCRANPIRYLTLTRRLRRRCAFGTYCDLSMSNGRWDPKDVDSDGEVMVMYRETNERYNTISAALSKIDPNGTIVPGSKAHNWITESILSWMDEMTHDEVLKKANSARHTLKLLSHTIL